MVEINIEKKKKPVWPWILLLVIVALLIWAIYEFTIDRDNTETAALQTSGMLLSVNHQLNYTAQTVT